MNDSKKYFTKSVLMLTLLIICFADAAVYGGEAVSRPVAEAMVSSSGISWMPKVNYTKLILTISRPDGTVFSKTFASGASPYVNLADLMESQTIDGSYTYELCAVPFTGKNVRRDDGFSAFSKQTKAKEALTQTGYFTVRDGMIITPGAIEPENVISTAQDALSGTKDQVIIDDLIIAGSACIGFDCCNGENFGFDTLRLKENNLRIRFMDTSSSGSFPSNDWQITANDSANGGANKFSIDDIDSGRTPFTIEAGTRSNALYVDDSGRVGLGTSTPAEDLHIWYGDTPTIRLHQSGSGWAPQTWDLCGNEANFFIRDVTNGSRLPFRIKPSAPTDSFFMDSNGDIGYGTQNPGNINHLTGGGTDSAVKAHFQSNGNVKLVLDNKLSNVGLVFTAGGTQTHIGSMTNTEFRFYVDNDWRMRLNPTSDTKVLEMRLGTGGGAYSDGTDWFPSSSRELKENINNLSVGEAMEALANLNPVKYNYKSNKEEARVGFIAEDVPEIVAVNGRKHLNSMDIVAVLTKVLQEQQRVIAELKKEIAELKKK
jgi:hypothetical protein